MAKCKNDQHEMVRSNNPHASSNDKAHVKKISTYSNLGPVKKGDAIHIDANYDFNKHEGSKSKVGAYTEVMGIAIIYGVANPSEMSG
jgi:hypothetical protein